MIWLLSAFKPNVPISIQAWLLLTHTGTSTGTSTWTRPSFILKYWCMWVLDWLPPVLASHRLDPCKALNLRSVCSRQLHGNLGPCSPLLPGENFNSHIEVQLPVELENTHLLCSPTLISGEAWVH